MSSTTGKALQQQIASHMGWARTADRTARTAPGRKASDERFEHLVDPDRKMHPEARAKAAASARKAHYLKMALRSAEVRRSRRTPRAA